MENNTQIKKRICLKKKKRKSKQRKIQTKSEKKKRESAWKRVRIRKKEEQAPKKEEESKKTNKENTYEPKITKKINVLTIIIDKTETLTDIPSEKSSNSTQLTRLKIESVNQEGYESSCILNLNQFTLSLINPEGITLSCQHKEIELKCQTYRIIK